MKKTIVLILLTCLTRLGYAQTNFIGQIKNSETYVGVESAFIEVKNKANKYTAASTPNGSFKIENMKAGTYTVTITHIGYQTNSQEMKIPTEDVAFIYLEPDFAYLDAAIITTVRAKNTTPSTFTNLNKKEIQSLDQSKDFPFLLNMTPSTVISSDAGNGIGYTGVRVRGIDPTRVNVTINGIPLNDAESQGVYWVNLPDLASSTQSVQIQRGIGASTNGPGAFGASVNIRTNSATEDKYTTAVIGLGSFNSFRTSVGVGSGRMENNWAFEARGSMIESDGFIDRSSSSLLSANLSATKFFEHSVLKGNVLLGHERTSQAWWGIPQPKFNQDIGDLNRFTTDLYIVGDELALLQNSNSQTYNYYTYENEVDNYNQNHYQLFYDHYFQPNLKLNTAAYVTTGKGYFEQYKAGEDLVDYGLGDEIIGTDTFSSGDVIRRRWLDNTLIGGLASVSYQKSNLDMTVGGGYNIYNGRHFGEAIATEFTGYEDLNAIYYDNDAIKSDANAFLKLSYNFKNFIPYIDLQQRAVSYQFERLDDSLDLIPQRADYTFFNPKFGMTYLLENNTFYGMFAVGNREPVRDDFTDNKITEYPEHEQMNNIELGYRYAKKRTQIGINLYDMSYTNQLVLTGAVNDVGDPIRTNVGESYRRGIEMEFQVPLSKKLQVGGNATVSENKIASFTESTSEWTVSDSVVNVSFTNTDISFSPNRIAALMLSYKPVETFTINMMAKHVGDQFLDNTQSEDRKLDAFTTMNVSLQFATDKVETIKRLSAGLYLNNVLNASYAPNGYTFGALLNGRRTDFNYVYPMAGFNWMLKVAVTL